LHEQLLEIGDHRAIYLDVGVAPAGRRVLRLIASLEGGSARVDAADVDAANEGRAPIHHQQLAVVSVVERPWLRHRRVEFEHLDAGLPQAIEERRGRGECAKTVIDQVDLDALRLPLEQEIGELAPHFIIVDDVGFHVDMVFCLADCGEHGLVRGRAVLQQHDLVADHERTADDVLFERDLLVEAVEVPGLSLEIRHDGGASFLRKLAEGVFESRGLRGVTLGQGVRIG